MYDTGSRCDDADGRLPRPSPFTPLHYNVELQPDIYRDEGPPFPLIGHVSIHVRCELETATMTLNADGINVTDQSVALLDDDADTDRQPAINDVRLT